MYDTIWSKIIWDKLGKKDFTISQDQEEADELVLEWVKSAPQEEILQLIQELSHPISENVDYYDGPFHLIGEEYSSISALQVHETEVLPLIIHLLIKFPYLAERLSLIQKIVNEYHKKGNKQ